MRQLIKYEWKKIWGSRLNQLAAAGCCLFLLFCVCSTLAQSYARDENGKPVYGAEAIKIIRETTDVVPFTQEWVNGVMKEFVDYTNNPKTASDNPDLNFLSEEMYTSYYWKNRELFTFLTQTYGEMNGSQSLKEIFALSQGKDFYQSRKESIEDRLDFSIERENITGEQKDYWVAKDSQVKIRQYAPQEVFTGWKYILVSLQWVILVMLLVCVGIGPVYSGEYASGEDALLLTMRYGKTKLVKAKLVTSFLHVSVLYWGIVLSYSAVFLLILGAKGGTLPIQLFEISLPSSYPLAIWQAVLVVYLLGYGAVLCMAAFTLLLSSLFSNSYGVIIVVFLSLMIPAFLYQNMGGYLWQHILALLPAKVSEFSFQSYMAYTIFGRVISLPVMMGLVYLLCIVVFVPASAIFFKKHQVNR